MWLLFKRREGDKCWRIGQKWREVSVEIEVERGNEGGIISQSDQRRGWVEGNYRMSWLAPATLHLLQQHTYTQHMSPVSECHWNSSNSAPWQQCFLCRSRWGENNPLSSARPTTLSSLCFLSHIFHLFSQRIYLSICVSFKFTSQFVKFVVVVATSTFLLNILGMGMFSPENS